MKAAYRHTFSLRKAVPRRPPATVFDVVQDAARRFEEAGLSYGHGTSNAFDDAAFIVLEVLGLPIDSLEKRKNRRLNEAQQKAVAAAVSDRIATRKPSSYLLNKAYIQGIPFYVDERVIVPRSFIGELLYTEGGFSPPGMSGNILTVLDLCTGSGCLAILAAHIFPDARIDAVELSADALAVARRNVTESGMTARITLFEGDLFAPLQGKKYDLIITNPPYVDVEGLAALTAEHRHEPNLAFDGGTDGLDILRRIVREAPQYLTERGGLLCESGRGRTALEQAFPHLPFLWLETENSTDEVFWITRRKMEQHAPGS